MACRKEMDALKKESRLGGDPGVDKIEVDDDKDGQEAFLAVERWLDELGI